MDVLSLEQVSTLVSSYPELNKPHKAVVNVQYDLKHWKGLWQLEMLEMNETNWTLGRYNFAIDADEADWLYRFNYDLLFESFEQPLLPNTLYHLEVNETAGDGMRQQAGWITITNSTKDENNPKDGTVVWSVMGDAFQNSTEVYIWIDNDGRTLVVDYDDGLKLLQEAWNSSLERSGAECHGSSVVYCAWVSFSALVVVVVASIF